MHTTVACIRSASSAALAILLIVCVLPRCVLACSLAWGDDDEPAVTCTLGLRLLCETGNGGPDGHYHGPAA